MIERGSVSRRAVLADVGVAMRTPNEYFRRLAQQAMETHRLSERGLAQRIGCGWGSVAHILSEEDVRMTQTQWFNLMALGGAFRNESPNV